MSVKLFLPLLKIPKCQNSSICTWILQVDKISTSHASTKARITRESKNEIAFPHNRSRRRRRRRALIAACYCLNIWAWIVVLKQNKKNLRYILRRRRWRLSPKVVHKGEHQLCWMRKVSRFFHCERAFSQWWYFINHGRADQHHSVALWNFHRAECLIVAIIFWARFFELQVAMESWSWVVQLRTDVKLF